MNQFTIVKYHYVRPIENSRYPRIKGLEFEAFKRQLDYLSNRFTLITAGQLIAHSLGEQELPINSCYLTFDDGYKDHVEFVLPELLRRGIQGSFFASVLPVVGREMLDINSIHFILAFAENRVELVETVNKSCLERGISAKDLAGYWNEYGKANRWDCAEVVYLKCLLQYLLPEELRAEITSCLFENYVGLMQSEFADELYMSTEDVKELISSGMYVGSHGFKHYWLNRESYESQEKDIQRSIDFLEAVGVPTNDWIMCYPHGAFNDNTLDIFRKKNCAIGLTVKAALADLSTHDRLTLPRFDTNDFPQ